MEVVKAVFISLGIRPGLLHVAPSVAPGKNVVGSALIAAISGSTMDRVSLAKLDLACLKSAFSRPFVRCNHRVNLNEIAIVC